MADPIKCPECGHAGHLHHDATGCDEKECFCIRTLGGIALDQLVELRAAVEAIASNEPTICEVGFASGPIRTLPNEHPADALCRWNKERIHA